MQFSTILIAAFAACAVSAQNSTTKAGKGDKTSTAGIVATGGASTSEATAKATATGKGSNSTATTTKAASAGKASATASSTKGSSNSSTNTSTASPVKVSANAAAGMLAQSGGFVTVAGLGVMFAVFM